MIKKTLISSLVMTLVAANAIAADAAYVRQAAGDITQPGGARRLSADQTEMLKAALNAKTAKNVILLIGDGMGDSEITVARNYAMGAGGFFKGIDALPLTGQYTHYSLDKKNPQTGLRDRLRCVRHGLVKRCEKPTTARWAWMLTAKTTKPCWKSPKQRAKPPATSPPPNWKTLPQQP